MGNISVCCVLLICVGLAMGDVDVYFYNYQNYDFTRLKQATVPTPRSLFTFGYNQSDNITMDVFLKNTGPNMFAAVYSMQPSGNNMKKEESIKYSQEQKDFYKIRPALLYSNISIEIELNTTTGLCTRKMIAEGKEGTEYKRNCLNTDRCMIEVDLRNIHCDGWSGRVAQPVNAASYPVTHIQQASTNTHKLVHPGLVAGLEPDTPDYGNAETTSNFNDTSEDLQPLSSSLEAVLAYAIPSAILICVILLVVCIVVKKFCHRNSPSIETIQLNTYTPNENEVIYADLSLAHEGSQPPSRDEESPYAKIAGVLNPNKK